MRIVNPIPHIKTYFYKGLSLFKNGNEFLVVEILNHETKATFIKVDFEKRTFHILKSLSSGSLDNLAPKLGKLDKQKIILLIDPAFAATLYTSVPVVRENAKEPIDGGDLDNLISRAIWSFFDRQRSKVAAKMSVSDLEVVLSDVQINGIKLDGHKVGNPLGFQAKTVEIQLALTFTARDFINNVKKVLPKENLIFIGEDGPTFSYLLSRRSENNAFVLANLFPEATTLFAVSGQSIAYLDKFEWGQKHLIAAVAENLHLSMSVAAAVLDRYIVGSASPYFVKRLENLLAGELHSLVRGLDEALKRSGLNQLYLHSFFPLPPAVYSGVFKNKFSHSLRLQPVTNSLISEQFNHEIRLRKDEDLPNALATIAGILLSFSFDKNEKISKMAKRRIRWLT